MTYEDNTLRAAKGKVLRRKGHPEEVFGDEIVLGISHYIGGIRQDPPHIDTPDDFEEVNEETAFGEDATPGAKDEVT